MVLLIFGHFSLQGMETVAASLSPWLAWTWSIEQAGCVLVATLLPLPTVYWRNRACWPWLLIFCSYDVLTCLGCDELEETGANSGDSKQGLQARLPVQAEEFRARALSTCHVSLSHQIQGHVINS